MDIPTRIGLIACLLWASMSQGYARSFSESQLTRSRVAKAHAQKAGELDEMFRAAGAVWPPAGLFVRAFKLEGELEVWAPSRTGKLWVKVALWPICRRSGSLGPKRFEGDGQVPEGVYRIERFNPGSAYHLSLGLNYPNFADRLRAGPGRSAGSDIFIHGGCVTVGCLPMTDRLIEYLYLSAVYVRDRQPRPTPVHIFPCRFGSKACRKALSEASSQSASLRAFWHDLRPIYDAFEDAPVPPRVITTRLGRYRLMRERQKPQR